MAFRSGILPAPESCGFVIESAHALHRDATTYPRGGSCFERQERNDFRRICSNYNPPEVAIRNRFLILPEDFGARLNRRAAELRSPLQEAQPRRRTGRAPY